MPLLRVEHITQLQLRSMWEPRRLQEKIDYLVFIWVRAWSSVVTVVEIEDSKSFLLLWNFDWFPSFLITVRRGKREGGGVPCFPTLNFKTHHFVYFTITEEAMLLLVFYYILFVLFFVTVVAVSRPCRLLEFYLNRASTSHGIALYYIRPGYFPGDHTKRSSQRSRKGKYIDFIPTLLGAPPPKQYSTPPLIPPATQATCSSHPSTLTPHHYPHPSLTSFTPY